VPPLNGSEDLCAGRHCSRRHPRRSIPISRGILLKLESLQVTGSFKARGAINAVLTLPVERLQRGIVTASGGNHGLAVAYAGWAVAVPATVFLPRSVAADKLAKLSDWGAQVVVVGEVWDDSNQAALQHAEAEGRTYIHPFADPAVIGGAGTIALEILEQAPDVDTLVVAIGGGGLISGIAIAAKALKPGIRIIGGAQRRADPPRKHCRTTSRRADDPRHRCGHLGAAP
jgi:threonine dehydratase